MVPRIGFFFSSGATIFTPAAAMVTPRANVACRLALHGIVGAVCVQENTCFCTLSSSGIVNWNWLCACRPDWKVSDEHWCDSERRTQFVPSVRNTARKPMHRVM